MNLSGKTVGSQKPCFSRHSTVHRHTERNGGRKIEKKGGRAWKKEKLDRKEDKGVRLRRNESNRERKKKKRKKEREKE